MIVLRIIGGLVTSLVAVALWAAIMAGIVIYKEEKKK